VPTQHLSHVDADGRSSAPPGGIIATAPIIEHARKSAPELARQFRSTGQDFVLDPRHSDPVQLWVAPAADAHE
jgi:hypothetical protein